MPQCKPTADWLVHQAEAVHTKTVYLGSCAICVYHTAAVVEVVLLSGSVQCFGLLILQMFHLLSLVWGYCSVFCCTVHRWSWKVCCRWSWKACFVAAFGIVCFYSTGVFVVGGCLDDWDMVLSCSGWFSG